jgi:hypothetical protein
MSTTLVPSAYKNLIPLSVVDQVGPVPETVLNSTVKTPTVPLITVYSFSTLSGIVTDNIPSNSSC